MEEITLKEKEYNELLMNYIDDDESLIEIIMNTRENENGEYIIKMEKNDIFKLIYKNKK